MENCIKLNYLFEGKKYCEVVNYTPQRDWMNNTNQKYVYRCLPMTIANQCGYTVLNPSSFKAKWNGNDDYNGVEIEHFEDYSFNVPSSHFGNGILTLHVDFIVTTNNENSIYVKGPSNFFRKNINPLEGIVETFWLPFSFTMNYKFYEPGEVIFEKGTPLFSFFPINLNYIESFNTEIDYIQNDPQFKEKVKAYDQSRDEHLKNGFTDGLDWQKYYLNGISPGCPHKNKNHKTKLNIKKFVK